MALRGLQSSQYKVYASTNHPECTKKGTFNTGNKLLAMKSNKNLFVLLTGIAVVACQKNDDSRITYPSVYRKSGLKPAGETQALFLKWRNPGSGITQPV